MPGLGSCTWDAFAAGDDDRNFYLWGAMGGAAMIGLGLALAKPNARVAVITGDGEMLMGMGSLATIGVQKPNNLAIVVFDNGLYGETGMQESHTSGGVDLLEVARGCGIERVIDVEDEAGLAGLAGLLATSRRDAVRPRSHQAGRSAARAAGEGRRRDQGPRPPRGGEDRLAGCNTSARGRGDPVLQRRWVPRERTELTN